jgi:hypothetical protein
MKKIRYKHTKVRILRKFYTLHKKYKFDHTHVSQKPPATVEVLAVHLTGITEQEKQKLNQELLRVFEIAVKSGHVQLTHKTTDTAQNDDEDNKKTHKSVDTEHSRWIHDTDTAQTDYETFGEQVQNTIVTIWDALVEQAQNALACTEKALGL